MEKNTETLGDEERSFDSADESQSDISNFLDSQEDVVMSDHEPEDTVVFLNQITGGGTVPSLLFLKLTRPQEVGGTVPIYTIA